MIEHPKHMIHDFNIFMGSGAKYSVIAYCLIAACKDVTVYPYETTLSSPNPYPKWEVKSFPWGYVYEGPVHDMLEVAQMISWIDWCPVFWHLDCLLNRLLRRRSKQTSKLRVTCLCEGKSPVTGEFPTQKASNA